MRIRNSAKKGGMKIKKHSGKKKEILETGKKEEREILENGRKIMFLKKILEI